MAAKRLNILRLGAALAGPLLVGPASAGKADVLQVEVTPSPRGAGFDFAVTVRHDDSGWDHYANRWEVVGPDGRVIATRTLFHPHVDEQPFTRHLRGVAIAPTVTWVRVRGHDLVHGDGGRVVTVSVPHPPAGSSQR